MNTTAPAIRLLARRLIDLEAAREPSDGPVALTVRACDKLRAPLAKLVGVTGYYSLMSRALAMAKAESPSLEAARVLPDGSLEGLDGAGRDAEAGAVVVAQLLELLVTFIGEPLTMGLVGDAWSQGPSAEVDPRSRGGS